MRGGSFQERLCGGMEREELWSAEFKRLSQPLACVNISFSSLDAYICMYVRTHASVCVRVCVCGVCYLCTGR